MHLAHLMQVRFSTRLTFELREIGVDEYTVEIKSSKGAML